MGTCRRIYTGCSTKLCLCNHSSKLILQRTLVSILTGILVGESPGPTPGGAPGGTLVGTLTERKTLCRDALR